MPAPGVLPKTKDPWYKTVTRLSPGGAPTGSTHRRWGSKGYLTRSHPLQAGTPCSGRHPSRSPPKLSTLYRGLQTSRGSTLPPWTGDRIPDMLV